MFAAPAYASTVAYDSASDTLTFAAAAGEHNDVKLTFASGTFTVTDAEAPVTAGVGCAPSGAGVTCAAAAPKKVVVDAGDQDDRVVLGPLDATAQLVNGGPGDDYLVGTVGPETLDGGAGDDLIDGDAGADVLIGGDGDDVVDYGLRTEGVTVYLDGSKPSGGASDGAGDTLSGIENVWSGRGNDTLIGDVQNNLLNGGYGADLLAGGAGDDYADYSERSEAVTVKLEDAPTSGSAGDGPLGARDTLRDIENIYGGDGNDSLTGSGVANFIDGGPGDDAIDVYDGVRDEVDCGLGNADKANGDLSDVAIGFNCETFVRSTFIVPIKIQPPVVQAPPVFMAPSAPALGVTLGLGKLPKLAAALSKGLAVTGNCS
jgi:Ca2+-binding RTX toxin-like protein